MKNNDALVHVICKLSLSSQIQDQSCTKANRRYLVVQWVREGFHYMCKRTHGFFFFFLQGQTTHAQCIHTALRTEWSSTVRRRKRKIDMGARSEGSLGSVRVNLGGSRSEQEQESSARHPWGISLSHPGVACPTL